MYYTLCPNVCVITLQIKTTGTNVVSIVGIWMLGGRFIMAQVAVQAVQLPEWRRLAHIFKWWPYNFWKVRNDFAEGTVGNDWPDNAFLKVASNFLKAIWASYNKADLASGGWQWSCRRENRWSWLLQVATGRRALGSAFWLRVKCTSTIKAGWWRLRLWVLAFALL